MLAIGWLRRTAEFSWRAVSGGYGGEIECKPLDLVDICQRLDQRELSGKMSGGRCGSSDRGQAILMAIGSGNCASVNERGSNRMAVSSFPLSLMGKGGKRTVGARSNTFMMCGW